LQFQAAYKAFLYS